MRKRQTKGFSIVEMLIYLGVLVLFTLLVVESIVMMSTSYRKLVAARIVSNSAMVAMEHMTREIRKAIDADSLQSVFGASPGRLRLNTTNDVGLVQTVSFALEDGKVNLYEDDVLIGPLSSARASTTNLVFRYYSNGKSKAVDVHMTIQATSGDYTRSESFRSTVVMRNSL